MEIMIKMTFVIILISTAIMIIVFNCFKRPFKFKKQCCSLLRTHKFQKRITKMFTICRINLHMKNVSVTAITKLMQANLSILITTKFKNQNLSKANDKVFLKTWLLSFLGNFLHTLGIIAFNIKRFSVCFFVSMSICMKKKNQNGTCIFLLEIPLIKQSRDLNG